MPGYIPRIVIDDNEVIASGTVISRGLSPIKFYPLETNPSFKLEILFFHREDSDPKISLDIVDDFVQISCINIDSNLGSGAGNPMYVARQNGHKVMLNFAMTIVGKGPLASRVFSYCFFDGGPDDV